MHFPGEGSAAVFDDIGLKVISQGVKRCDQDAPVSAYAAYCNCVDSIQPENLIHIRLVESAEPALGAVNIGRCLNQ